MTDARLNPIEVLRRQAAGCRACRLWENATQTVFGEGAGNANIMFVGEQPGDREDRAGRPFVGPAGQMFDRALTEADIDRKRIYVTNAVKHFKFTPRGKRRLHKKPSIEEINVCKRWLLAEIEALKPSLVVALGATAARSLSGQNVAIAANRGKTRLIANGLTMFVTTHPSALLRMPDEAAREAAYAEFVKDMRTVAALSVQSGRAGARLA